MALNFAFDKAKKFKFTAQCRDLEQTLSKINGILGTSASQTKNYFLVGKGKQLCVVAFNQDTFCAVRVPNATSESDGAFGYELTTMLGIIKGRAAMDFDFTGNDLQFKLAKGKYSGSIVTLPVTDEQAGYAGAMFTAAEKKGASKNALSRDLLDTLKEGIAFTSIKDVYNSTDLLSHITFTSKSIQVSAFSQHHFALYTKKVKDCPQFRVALPVSHFNAINRLSENDDKDAAFILRPESIRVEGKSFLLVLPATQTEESNFDLVQNFLKNKTDFGYVIDYDHKKLTTLVDNLITLNAANTAFDIALKGDSLQFTFVTPSGSASDSFKVKKAKSKSDAAKASIDISLLRDLIGLAANLKESQLCMSDKLLAFKGAAKSGGSLTLASALLSK